MQTAIVLNEPHLPESVHEETDSGSRSADNFRQRFLAHLRNHRLRLAFFSEVSQQEEHPRQALLA